MVRLLIAIANMAPKTPAQVMVEIVRHPSLGMGVPRSGGELNSMSATVHSRPTQEVSLMVSLLSYGKVAVQQIVHLFPYVE